VARIQTGINATRSLLSGKRPEISVAVTQDASNDRAQSMVKAGAIGRRARPAHTSK